MARPKAFIGSSRERLPIAHALKDAIETCADATVWDEAEWDLGDSILDGLIEAAAQYDFAIFVFGQDDSAVIRNTDVQIVRDNVIFELGLFIGRIGRGRAVWLSPSGSEAPHKITDLEGIIHLSFDNPGPDRHGSLPESLSTATAKICKQVNRLGVRNDRAIEEVDRRRILCVASSQYSQDRFAADIEYIHHFFSEGEVTKAHGLTADQFEDFFAPNKVWDIVHLGVFVDKENENMLFDEEIGIGTRRPVSIKAMESMIKDCGARLVIIITCDSLAFGARLARFTNVIAGHRPIAAGEAISWAKVFYQSLAAGAPLSQAFNTAQDRADPGLLLLSHKDVRFPPAIAPLVQE